MMNITESVLTNVTFSWIDYALFLAMVGLSILIGLYFGCCGHQDSAKEYLHGGKKMSVVPIAISLVASNISGITLLGVPTEVYQYGSTYYVYTAMLLPIYLVTYYIFLPVFYKLQLVSTYEYLMLRFDRKVRLLASGLNTVNTLLYLPIVVYIPALALAQVTQISLHLVTPVLCGVCIFYTTIGGLKAVVWTDTLQFFVMMAGIIGVFYLGLVSVGGFSEMWSIAVPGKRLDFDFDLDPTKRDTVFATMTGTAFFGFSYISTSQSFVQKYLSMPKMSDVKRALILFSIGMIIILSLVVLTGLIMYARYHDCDPYTAGLIAKADQTLPFYVMDVASTIPGLPGLFLSGLFSAALSTLSACMNCLAGSVYEDFISPLMPKDITQKSVSNILKLLVLTIGVTSTALVFVIEHMGNVFAINYNLSGITNGPLLGLFCLGMLFTNANAKGALLGSLGSLAIMSFIIGGRQMHQLSNHVQHVPKPVSILGCDNSTILHPNLPSSSTSSEDIFVLFRITHYYYCFLGTIFTIILGLIFSHLTKKKSDPPVNPDLISPITHRILNGSKTKKQEEKIYFNVKEALNVVTHPEKQ